MTDKRELNSYLKNALSELNKLSEQIRQTRDYSGQAEAILCLREFVAEQFEMVPSENTHNSDHQAR